MVNRRPNLAQDLDSITIPQTEKVVIKVCRKLFGGKEVIDVRLWFKNPISQEFYTTKRQGICLNIEAWKKIKGALEAMNIYTSNEQVDSHLPDSPSQTA